MSTHGPERTYAVKIGEVLLTSGEPITQERRQQAIRQLEALQDAYTLRGDGGTEFKFSPAGLPKPR